MYIFINLCLSARCRFDAVSVGDIVYFVGGMCNDPHQKTLEMYYPNLPVNKEENHRMEQVQTPSPKLPRYDHCTTVSDGKIYFIGGSERMRDDLDIKVILIIIVLSCQHGV